MFQTLIEAVIQPIGGKPAVSARHCASTPAGLLSPAHQPFYASLFHRIPTHPCSYLSGCLQPSADPASRSQIGHGWLSPVAATLRHSFFIHYFWTKALLKSTLFLLRSVTKSDRDLPDRTLSKLVTRDVTKKRSRFPVQYAKRVLSRLECQHFVGKYGRMSLMSPRIY
jgi:hypothetical protein